MTAQPGWEVADATASSARTVFDYSRPDLLEAFPFPHHLVLEVEVGDGRLRVATTVRPTGDRRVPISFGWHPYFTLSATRAESRLRLPACEHLLLDAHGLPTGSTEPQPEGTRPIGDRAYDDGYALGNDRRLTLESDQRVVTVELGDGYPFAQVYSPSDASFACLEAMTAPTNALVTGAARLVEPDEQFTAEFTVTVARPS
jgi:galactose mutarotase-like enzyme